MTGFIAHANETTKGDTMSRKHPATHELELTLAAIATVRQMPLAVVLSLVDDRRHAAEVFEAYDSNACVRRHVNRALSARLQEGARSDVV